MDIIKKFLAGKGVGYYLTLPALIFCIIALSLYTQNGVTSFNPELNASAIAYISVCIALCVISLVVDFRPIKYIAYLLCLYAFMWFIYSQVTYIANVFVAIDGYTFTGGFIATTVFYVLSFVFVLLSAVLGSWRPWKKKTQSSDVGGATDGAQTAPQTETVTETVTESDIADNVQAQSEVDA